MTFIASGFLIKAFQMAGPFLMNATSYRGGCWIVIGRVEGQHVVMTDDEFQQKFRNRRELFRKAA